MKKEEEKKVVENAISLDIPEIARTNVWVNGDCTKVLRLNLSDMNIMKRLRESYPKLDELTEEVQSMMTSEEITSDEVIDAFDKINQQMKDIVDSIFDFPVSDMMCDGGSMYDIIGGQLRFEYIIDKLAGLYESTVAEEAKRLNARLAKHTNKYTKSATKKRK